ncbi:MAG TPA: hypothetical protein VHW01_16970 [Polyangiaceae bacterium]|nr:hypothetical protein [Polyangiaceae bacterium]
MQTKSYWHVVAVAGVVGLVAVSACTVTTASDDSSTAGDTSFAGTTVDTGGTTGTAGTTNTGGTTATDSYECDPADGSNLQDTPATSCALATADDCSTCVQSNCCDKVMACYGTDPGNECGFGGPPAFSGANGGEFACIRSCIQAGVANGPDDPDLRTMCYSQCATSVANGAVEDCPGPIGIQTNDLVGCVSDNCLTECFGG